MADPATSKAVIIDPVLDYDPCTQAITTTSADALLALVKEKGYTIECILETHAHADHLTSSSYLQKQLTQAQGFKPPIGIGKRIEQVQKLFAQRYGLTQDEWLGVFDRLFDDDETFTVGELTVKAIHLPGHTPDHLGYRIGGKLLVPTPQPRLIEPRLTLYPQTTSSAATPSSTQISAPRAATSPVATQRTSSNQGADCSV